MKDLLLARGISELARIAESEQRSATTFKFPSDSDLSHIVDAKSLEQHLASISGVEAADVESIAPCTPLQENMLEKSSEGFYNLEMIFEIHYTGYLDIPQLRKAWRHVMERHSALRTIFVKSTERQGEHDQIILKRFESSLVEVEMAQQPTLRIRPSISSHLAYSSNEPHHRLTVQRTRHGESFMKLNISHALTDAVSLGTAFRDLGLAYSGRLSTQSTPQFFQYHAHLWRQAESDHAYWQGYCRQSSPCYMPRLFRGSTGDVKLLHTAVEQPDPTAVLPFCQRNGVSVANLFHAIWALVLRFHTTASSNEVVFGYLVSGRDTQMEGIESVVGPLISTLIYRNRLRDSTMLVQLLTEVRDDAARSSSRKYCNLRQIERELGLEKPLFNTMINFR